MFPRYQQHCFASRIFTIISRIVIRVLFWQSCLVFGFRVDIKFRKELENIYELCISDCHKMEVGDSVVLSFLWRFVIGIYYLEIIQAWVTSDLLCCSFSLNTKDRKTYYTKIIILQVLVMEYSSHFSVYRSADCSDEIRSDIPLSCIQLFQRAVYRVGHFCN